VTAVECLRAQLAEANEKINNLSAEVHDRKGGLRHNQLEELRNLQFQTILIDIWITSQAGVWGVCPPTNRKNTIFA
jgi:hypothetical protein